MVHQAGAERHGDTDRIYSQVGTTSLAEQAARRKKRIAGLAVWGLAATALVVAVAFWWSNARKETPLPVPQVLPTNVHQQLAGYSFTRSIEGRQIFTVHAARTVAFKEGGTTVLEDVMVEVFGREGNRHDVLRTGQCEYRPESGDLFSSGKVEIDLSRRVSALGGPSLQPGPAAGRRRDPVHLETARLFFRQKGSLVITEEPVQFRVGPASGSARGMVYATQGGWLELKKDVIAELAVQSVTRGLISQESIRLAASHLRYDAPRGGTATVKLDGPLQVVQGTRSALAERGTVFLDDHERVTRVVLEGNVRGLDSSESLAIDSRADRVEGEFDPATGQLRTMLAEGNVVAESHRGAPKKTSSRLVAQQFVMTFLGVRPRPQVGTASGNVHLALESPGALLTEPAGRGANDRHSVERKTLSAGQVRFVFQPGSVSLSQIATVGTGQLTVLPADPGLGEREITAGQLVMDFDKAGRLASLRGFLGAHIVFRPSPNAPAGTPPQESFSERLEASFDPATQALRQVDQIENFQFQEGDRRGSAQQATYSPAAELFTLIGHPEVSDATTRFKAERILFDLRADTAEGEGKVESMQFEAQKGERQAGVSAGSTGTDDPTHVLADRALADRRSQFVRYRGHVRAWHGTDVVESPSLDVYRAERRISSGSRVVTSHFQSVHLDKAAGTNSPPARETRPVTIRADRLEYFDQGRKAAYRGNVQFQMENTVLKADRLDVYFSLARATEASEIQRAVADGHVLVVEPGRRATGEHAEYDAGPGRIQVTGGPPALYDEQKGFVTGERLTFFVHDDRLLVDGGDKSPTLSQHRVAQ